MLWHRFLEGTHLARVRANWSHRECLFLKREGNMWPITGLLKGPGFLSREGVGWWDLPSQPWRTQCVVGVLAPSLALGVWRGEPGRENVSYPELGLWVQPESGSSVGRNREGGWGQTLIEELPLFSLNWNPRTTKPQKVNLTQQLGKSSGFGQTSKLNEGISHKSSPKYNWHLGDPLGNLWERR